MGPWGFDSAPDEPRGDDDGSGKRAQVRTMTDDNNARLELSRRKVLGGMATVGVAGAGAGAGTWAYFSDEGSSGNNSLSAGTLELADVDDEAFQVNDAAPGDTERRTLTIEEAGTLDGEAMDIDATIDTDSEGDFSDQLNVIEANFGGDDRSSGVDTLTNLANTTLEYGAPGSGTDFTLGLEFDEEAGNDYQGAEVVFTLTFTLYQDASQQGS